MAAQTEGLERQTLLFDAMAHLLSDYAGVREPRDISFDHPRAVHQAKAFMASDLDCYLLDLSSIHSISSASIKRDCCRKHSTCQQALFWVILP
jgi:hypothetical protein